MADAARALLEHIVRTYALHDALVSVELDASASDRPEAISADQQERVRQETERADNLAHAFARGLTLAYNRHAANGGDLTLDDRKPAENAMADALIRFLVSHQFATSRTEETTPLHYAYHIAVDWPRLTQVAREANVDLNRIIGRTS